MERNGGSEVVVGGQEWRKWRNVAKVKVWRGGFSDVDVWEGKVE